MLGNVKKNWKTTFSGILVLLSAGWGIAQNPALLTQPEVIGQLIGGIGLIVAKDASKSGTVSVPKE